MVRMFSKIKLYLSVNLTKFLCCLNIVTDETQHVKHQTPAVFTPTINPNHLPGTLV